MFSGTYGHPLVQTPHLDGLAENGVLFENSYGRAPIELYDLVDDPGELHDLTDNPDYEDVRESLHARLLSHWNPIDLEQRIRQSQIERLLIRTTTQ